MDPQFGVASPSPLFPYSSGDSVDEQNRFVALELRDDSSSIVLRNETLARMVEHRIAVPARKQIDAPSHLDLYDPFNVPFRIHLFSPSNSTSSSSSLMKSIRVFALSGRMPHQWPI